MMWIIISFILSLCLFACAYRTTPQGASAGKDIKPPVKWKKANSTFTIGTYNVQTGKSLDGKWVISKWSISKRDISKSANVVKDVDIVCLQELYAASWLGQKSHAQKIAEYGNFGWLFAATRRRWFRQHRGNGLLSKFKVAEWYIEPLADFSGKSFRNLTTAKIIINKQPVWILNVHLHTKKGHTVQLATVLQRFAQYPRAILLGDFNTKSNDEQLKQLLKDKNVKDAIKLALPDIDHQHRIDWILTKGFDIKQGYYQEQGVSDHPYYAVELVTK